MGGVGELNYLDELSHDDEMNMRRALNEARRCTTVKAAFDVGAVLVAIGTGHGEPLYTGYSRQYEGNTHAEENALARALENQNGGTKREFVLYTTMEPCTRRLSGKTSCVDRIIDFPFRIDRIVIGALEPPKFVEGSAGSGVRLLVQMGLRVDILNAELELARECESLNICPE